MEIMATVVQSDSKKKTIEELIELSKLKPAKCYGHYMDDTMKVNKCFYIFDIRPGEKFIMMDVENNDINLFFTLPASSEVIDLFFYLLKCYIHLNDKNQYLLRDHEYLFHLGASGMEALKKRLLELNNSII